MCAQSSYASGKIDFWQSASFWNSHARIRIVIILLMNKSALYWILIIHMVNWNVYICKHIYIFTKVRMCSLTHRKCATAIVLYISVYSELGRYLYWVLCKFQRNHFIDILSIRFYTIIVIVIIIREHKTTVGSLCPVLSIYIFHRIDFPLCACAY